MVNYKWLWLLCLAWTSAAYGQRLSPQVLVPAGQTEVMAQGTLSWTLGQVADATLIGEEQLLTEGFQQPYLHIEVLPAPDVLAPPAAATQLACTLFPNPTSERVTVQISQPETQMGYLTLLDGNGKKLRQERVTLDEYRTEWDVSRLAAGVYYFRITTLEGTLLRTYQLTKS